jgi:hypothetical protein
MNSATTTIAATLGTILGFSGMSHGFFELLQGNTPTGGMFIAAIGEAHRMWPHGNEYALTLIPNFLATGILAMTTGLAATLWSVAFLRRKHGSRIYLLLFVLLLLVGGGVGQIPFFCLGWAVASRIHGRLGWWRRVLPTGVRGALSALWPWFLALGGLLLVFALEIAITGYVPGVSNPDTALVVMLSSLGVALGALLLASVAGFARDIERTGNPIGR